MEPPLKRQKLLAPSDVASNDSTHVPLDTTSSKGRYSCETCERSFVQKSSLGRHIREAHETLETSARFRCDLCEKEFRRPEGIRNHILKDRCTFRGKALITLDASPNGASPMDLSSMCTLSDGPCLDENIHATSQPHSSGRLNAWSRLQNLLGISARRILMSSAEVDRFLSELESFARPFDVRTFFDYLSTFWVLLSNDIVGCERVQEGLLRVLRQFNKVLGQFNKCKGHRKLYRGPFPPAFDHPTPQDLEFLLEQKSRERRRIRMVESFQSTHRKFVGDHGTPEDMQFLPTDAAQRRRFLRHRTFLKQAWRDGMDAALDLLSGSLPRHLHSVLGVAEIASGIRVAIEDIDSALASEEKFVSDLSRWRQILASNCHAAFDHYADLLWDHRPPSDSAWKEPLDAETLVYFQDLLAEMLSYIEIFVTESAPDEPAMSTSDLDLESNLPTTATSSPGPSPSTMGEFECADEEHVGTEEQSESVPAIFAEVVLLSAGAIFGLIVVFLLLHLGKFPSWVLCLCLITDRDFFNAQSAGDHEDGWYFWLQHQSLLTNCRLLELLLQLLKPKQSASDDNTLSVSTSSAHDHRSAVLGGMSWRQLICQCFDETIKAAFIVSQI